MGKTIITEEPLFQRKRKFKFPDGGFNLNKQFSNIKKEDDYILIGPSDKKFTNSIAYRNNNNKQRNTRSVSPKSHKENFDNTLKKSQPSINLQQCRQIHKPSTVLKTRIDEASQTDGAQHKALEAEIQRIRNEIDSRKRLLREKDEMKEKSNLKHDMKHSKPVETNQHQHHHNHNHSVNICVPDAPRQDKKCIKTSLLQDYGKEQNEKLTIPKYTVEKNRISEYQSAFKAPQINYHRLDSTQFIRPSSCKLDKFQCHSIPYDTEYRHEYKPFKYVPIDQLKSTDIIRDEKNVNIIPIKRPVSAYGIREIKDRDENINKKRIRALTPPTKIHKKTSHNISEYNAKYLNYTNLLTNQQNRSKSTEIPPYNWYQEIIILREKADEYRKRDRESHFSREHLAQLESDTVGYWDPSLPSNESYVENIEKYKEVLKMPRAGKPSTMDFISDSYNEPLASQRRKAMFNSYNIAQIMDQDDYSDIEEDQNQQYDYQPVNTNPSYSEYRHDVNYPRDNYVGMLPANMKHTPENELHYNSDYSLKSGNDDPSISLEGNCRVCNTYNNKQADYQDDHYHHRNHHPVGERTQYPYNTRKQRSLDGTESLTSCSSLSEKSMELSSRLACQTLGRAQRQHERILREQRLYNANVYSPTTYSNCKSVQ